MQMETPAKVATEEKKRTQRKRVKERRMQIKGGTQKRHGELSRAIVFYFLSFAGVFVGFVFAVLIC